MMQTSTDAVQTYRARGGMGSGICGGNAGTRGRPETILVLSCHTEEFVQMGLLLADSFLGMKEKCRAGEKSQFCSVQELWWHITEMQMWCVSSYALDSI